MPLIREEVLQTWLWDLTGMNSYTLRWLWSFLADLQLLLLLTTFHHSYSRAVQQDFWERVCSALSYNASNGLTAPSSAPQGWLVPSCSTVCRKLEACWMKGRWCDGQPLIPIGKLHNVDWEIFSVRDKINCACTVTKLTLGFSACRPSERKMVC